MLRFIILSLFLVGTVMLAPNTNFVVLPATEAHVCADCETQCANCNFPNNSSSSTGIISVQSQPTTTHIRNTNSENSDSETSTRTKRNIGSVLKSEIFDLASGLNSSAEAVLNSTGGFFNLLEPTLKATNFVSSIQSISWEISDLNNHDYGVQTMTEQLASKIVEANKILNQMGDAQSRFSINGGAALKSMASNIERLSSIIKVLGKGLQETETNCFNEKNNLTSNCDREQNKLDILTKEIEAKLKVALNDKVKLKDDIEFYEKEINAMKVKMGNLNEKLEVNKRLINNFQEANKKYIFKIIEYEETIKVLKSNSAVFEDDAKAYEDLISMEQNSIKENEQKIDEIKVENDKLEKEKEILQSNIDKESEKVKNLENNLATYKTEIINLDLENQLLVKDKDELVKNILDIKSENNKLEETIIDIDAKNLDLGNLNRKYVSDIEYLEKKLLNLNVAMAKMSNSNSSAVTNKCTL